MSFNPKISIVIPVYNGSNYLAEAIDCALSQTYGNFEVVVVNDGSTDDGATEKIALSYGDKIRYFKKENGGVSSALNFGIEVMEGEYFSWLSHDDKYTPDKLSNSVALLAQCSESDRAKTIACLGGSYINEKSEPIKNFSDPFDDGRLYSAEEMLLFLTGGYVLNGCCLLIPRAAFLECGKFDESLRYCQDIFMWYEMFLVGYSLVYRSAKDVMYRLHRAQTSQTRKDLFMKDSLYVTESLAPRLSERGGKFLFRYTQRRAMYDCRDAVKLCMRIASEKNPFSLSEKMRISMMLVYAKIRAMIKKIYYRLVLRVKV